MRPLSRLFPTLPVRAACRGAAAVCLLAAAGAAFAATPAPGPAQGVPAWNARLAAELPRIAQQHRAGVGVYVRDLGTQETAHYQSDESWYLASTVKVPVAIAVLRAVERGEYKLDTGVKLQASDYVDGAGLTNRYPVGTSLTIRYLIDQMIVHSDNTASDMLIGLVGVDEVNEVVASLVPTGFGRITTLAEVRRLAYGNLTPAARRLSGRQLILLNRQRSDTERMDMLSRFTGTPVTQFKLPSLEEAYAAYYASGLNSGRLDAYGELLAQLARGKALGPAQTDYLLKVMQRVETGQHRIKAGLPAGVTFAHKTGTQRRRFCDAGIAQGPGAGATAAPQRVVIVACTRGDLSLERSETALREVGSAICRSGLLTHGVIDAPSCPPVALPAAGRVPAAGAAAPS